MEIRYFLTVILFIFYFPVWAEDNDLCLGTMEILNISDRGGNLFSPCTVPFKKIFVEGGYQYLRFKPPGGWVQDFPQGEVRIGLPAKTELGVLFPNYFHVRDPAFSGYSTTALELKHQFWSDKHWLITGNA